MKYYVVDLSGQKYGPADIATLQAWAREGRVSGDSVLEAEGTGQRTTAAAVLGPTAFAVQPPFAQRQGGGAFGEQVPQTVQPGGALPYQLQGKFNWGAFFLGWIWGLNHKAYITLLQIPIAALGAFIPFVPGVIGLAFAIWVGFKGFEWAWQSGRFQTVEHCLEVQRIWMLWGIGVLIAGVVLGCVGGVLWAVLMAAGMSSSFS
ncbi:MAG: hypothetical protein AMXMBFR61_27520 [Fimbriimonadales bacterium]